MSFMHLIPGAKQGTLDESCWLAANFETFVLFVLRPLSNFIPRHAGSKSFHGTQVLK